MRWARPGRPSSSPRGAGQWRGSCPWKGRMEGLADCFQSSACSGTIRPEPLSSHRKSRHWERTRRAEQPRRRPRVIPAGVCASSCVACPATPPGQRCPSWRRWTAASGGVKDRLGCHLLGTGGEAPRDGADLPVIKGTRTAMLAEGLPEIAAPGSFALSDGNPAP